MIYKTLAVTEEAGIGIIALNRPTLMNALNAQMRAEITVAVRDLGARMRVLVLTGEGRAFCSGQDLGDGASINELDLARVLREEYEPMLRAIYECPVPVIAAVNGAAAGAGANLALAADVVIAAKSAVFLQAFARIGLIPDAGGTYWLPRLVGFARAMGQALFADKVTADEAAAMGLIWASVPDESFAADVAAFAGALAAGPLFAFALKKKALAASLGNTLPAQLALEADLRGAVARGEMTPYYQPVVRLQDGKLTGFEALCRWRHPRRGIIPPDDFLPLAEELGLMDELGAHMIRTSARQLAAWRASHSAAGDLTVSVNLSTGEIHRDGLIDDVTGLIAKHRLPPGSLKLEITESDIMRDPEGAAKVLRALRAGGAGLALDDFGTGFSSLSYLTRLPFDTLKIDRYFVRTMATNEGSAKIVKSVVKLGQDLNLEVVAEGVENAQMARQLMELGCDYGQGFGYAPALSPQEAEVYLNESYVDGAAPVRRQG